MMYVDICSCSLPVTSTVDVREKLIVLNLLDKTPVISVAQLMCVKTLQ